MTVAPSTESPGSAGTGATSGVVPVIIDDPHTMQEELDRAVELVQSLHGHSRGILLTRRSRSLFTVEASPAVPCGTVLQRDRWRRASPDRDGPQATDSR